MLDKNDLQAITQLMQQSNDSMRTELAQLIDMKLEEQEKRIISQVNSIIETKVTPQIQLIAEQHSDIIEKLSSAEEIDSLKGRVSTLEGVVKAHTAKIEDLKKAQ